MAKVHADGPSWRAPRGSERSGFSGVRREQLFHRKQSRGRWRLYLLVISKTGVRSSGVAGVTECEPRRGSDLIDPGPEPRAAELP